MDLAEYCQIHMYDAYRWRSSVIPSEAHHWLPITRGGSTTTNWISHIVDHLQELLRSGSGPVLEYRMVASDVAGVLGP